MNKRSFGTARLGLKTLPCVALVALGLLGAVGCASAPEPTSSSTPAPAATTAPTPAPSADPPAAAAPSNPAGTGATVSTPIDNATGGTVALPNGTSIDVPAGAMPPGVDAITVTSAPAAAPTEYTAASPVYVFGPDGTVFLKPLKVSLPFTAPAGMAISDLTILWSRSTGEGYDMVPTEIAPVAGSSTDYIAKGEVTHFSRGFCGAKFTTDPHPTPDAYGK